MGLLLALSVSQLLRLVQPLLGFLYVAKQMHLELAFQPQGHGLRRTGRQRFRAHDVGKVSKADGNGTRGPVGYNPLYSVVPGADDLSVIIEQVRASVFGQW